MVGLLVSFEFRTGDEDSSPLARADIKKLYLAAGVRA